MDNKLVNSIFESALAKIQGLKPLQKLEQFGHIWKDQAGNPLGGQIFRTKFLPNGNIKEFLITVFKGEKKPSVPETRTIDLSSDLVAASNGLLRGGSYESTTNGASLLDLTKNSGHLYAASPEAYRLNYFSKGLNSDAFRDARSSSSMRI